MFKEKLQKMLNDKKEQRQKLNDQLIASDVKEERAAIGETLKKLEQEIKDCEDLLANVDEPASEPNPTDEGEGRKMNIMDTIEQRNSASKVSTDKFDTPEYRNAFMNYVCRGVEIPKEYRADALTTTTEAAAAIPTTLLNEIIQKLESYGELYSRVRKLNIQGGVKVPILTLKPTATWIGETTDSDEQKLTANTSVEFSYYGLECKIAQSLLASVVTYDAFQALFVPLAAEAIAKAFDIAIMNGAGSTQPTGITKDTTRIPSANQITLSATDFAKWDGWKKKVFAKIPKSYRNGTFIMAQATFDGYIDGMVDANGQPIARVNYGITGEETYRFGGKEVITVEEDVLKAYETASASDVVAVFVNLNDYAINSNLQLQTYKWTDHNTNKVYNKAILIADGKLLDPNGVLLIKKGA